MNKMILILLKKTNRGSSSCYAHWWSGGDVPESCGFSRATFAGLMNLSRPTFRSMSEGYQESRSDV